MHQSFIPGKDLEDRTLQFAQEVRLFIRRIPRTISNIEDGKQLIRSSGSVGANYIEANESLEKSDFLMRAKIARKECKETLYWLKLIRSDESSEMRSWQEKLQKEATELRLILSRIIKNCSTTE